MTQRTYSSTVLTQADPLYTWHTRPGAFRRLVPPWMNVDLEEFEGIEEGNRASFRVGVGPFRLRWQVCHSTVEAGRAFADEQEKGPFSSWRHVHRFRPINQHSSRLIDEVEYELPAGSIGEQLASSWIRKMIDQQFAYRHRVTRGDHAVLNKYSTDNPLTVAVSGSSGLIGSALTAFLEAAGHTVRPIVRSKPVNANEIYWNYREGKIDVEKLNDVDAVVHLAAESVFAPRWTEQKKMRIYASRVHGTQFLVDALKKADNPPEVLVTASGMDYFGSRGDEVMSDGDPSGDDQFLSAVVQDWESAALVAREAGIRTVPLRFGIVLSPAGGALQLMRLPFLLGLGGTAGDPSNWLSWVALDDVLYAIYHAIFTDELDGPSNCAAPNSHTMEEFTDTLAGVLNRPSLFHIPGAVAKTVTGEVADAFINSSLRISPDRLQSTGFEFTYPDLESALRHLLGRSQHIPLAHEQA